MPIEVNALDGQEVSGATLRLANFQGTSGGNGVILPADLRVRALSVPGGAVRIIRGPSGGAVLRNPATGAGAQSYMTHATETMNVAVPATDSSGPKTRYIIQYIDTANNPGAHYACVDSLAEYVNVPHIKLARIEQPESRADIQPSMIFNEREVANPLERTVSLGQAILTGDNGLVLNASKYNDPTNVGEWWPNTGGNFLVRIPWWATRVIVKAKWHGVNIEANKNPYGSKWVEFGPYAGPSEREQKMQEIGFNSTNTGDIKRDPIWGFFGESHIPEDYRDEDHLFVMKARYNGADKGVYMDAYSATEMDLIFQMVAD